MCWIKEEDEAPSVLDAGLEWPLVQVPGGVAAQISNSYSI